MSPIAVILLIASSFTHAGWNMLSKKEQPSLAFFFLVSFSSFLIISPLIILYWDKVTHFPLPIWASLVSSSICLAIYFIGLTIGYNKADMSVIYPLVRALPVLFVALLTTIIGRAEPLSPLDITGMILVVFGCLATPMAEFSKVAFKSYFTCAGLVFAFIAAIGTTGYSIIDDSALTLLKNESLFNSTIIAIIYAGLQSLGASLFLFLISISKQDSRKNLLYIIQKRKISAATTGVAVLGSYVLVLIAMMFTNNVSHIVVFRQLSIPIGVFLGIFFLGEKVSKPKIIGVALIFTGLVIVGIV